MTNLSMEQEAIGLCICYEAVADMANHALLAVRPVSKYPGEAEVLFHSHIHEQLFLVRLLDFVKEPGSSSITGVNGSCLDVLQAVCAVKNFEHESSCEELSDAVARLVEWLNSRSTIKLWLPTLGIDARVEVSRLDFLFVAANQSKHNLSRLTGVSRKLHEILQKHGYEVQVEQLPLALDDFREHLQENYFVYYGTWLAELLNNVLWAITIYLNPQFKRSFQRSDEASYEYSYAYPDQIRDSVAQQWFWRLMNNIKTKPYIDRFAGAHYLKKECSLEWVD